MTFDEGMQEGPDTQGAEKKEASAVEPAQSGQSAAEVQKQEEPVKKEEQKQADATLAVELKNTEIEDAIKEKTSIKDLAEVANLQGLDLHKMEKEHPGLLGALFLRKLVQDSTEKARPDFFENLEKTDLKQNYNFGDTFIVDFQGNHDAEMKVGAGDMLPAQVHIIVVRTVGGAEIVGMRDSKPRPGYYNAQHEYIPVFQGDEIYLPTEDEAREKLHDQDFLEAQYKDKSVFNLDKDSLEQAKRDEAASRDELIDRFEHPEKYEVSDYDFFGDEVPSAGEEYGLPFALDQSMDEAELEKFMSREELSKMQIVQDIFAQFNLNEQDQAQLLCILKAIGGHETGNIKKPYEARGPLIEDPTSTHYGQRAVGKYQIMPKYWPDWSKKTFGKVVKPDQMSQEIVALRQMAEYFAGYRHSSRQYPLEDIVRLVAVCWYGNMGATKSDVRFISHRKPKVGPSPHTYSLDVLRRFKAIYN